MADVSQVRDGGAQRGAGGVGHPQPSSAAGHRAQRGAQAARELGGRPGGTQEVGQQGLDVGHGGLEVCCINAWLALEVGQTNWK